MDYFLKNQDNIYYNTESTFFPIFDKQFHLEQTKKILLEHDISKIYFKYISKYTIKYIESNIIFFQNEFGNNYLKLKQILKKYNISIDIFLKNRIDFNTFLFLDEVTLKKMGYKKGPTVLMKQIIKQYKQEYDYIKFRIQ
jgi:hypothetical protein